MIENLLGGGGGGGTVDTIQAGTGISVDATNPASPIITNTSLNTDEVAKVSSNDTTAGYLNGKLVAGTGVSFTENNNGGNETLTIASTVVNTDETAKVSSNDTTAGYLNGKLVAGTGISFTENNNGGNETLSIVNSAPGDTSYTVTIADAENTSNTITLAQFTVPANTWSAGEEIVLDMHFLVLNNTGSSQSVIYTTGGTTITDQVSSSLTVATLTSQAANFTRLRFVRLADTVAFIAPLINNGVGIAVGPWGPLASNVFNGLIVDSSVTFSSDITLYFKAKLNTASASYYIRTEHARAYKKPVGTV